MFFPFLRSFGPQKALNARAAPDIFYNIRRGLYFIRSQSFVFVWR